MTSQTLIQILTSIGFMIAFSFAGLALRWFKRNQTAGKLLWVICFYSLYLGTIGDRGHFGEAFAYIPTLFFLQRSILSAYLAGSGYLSLLPVAGEQHASESMRHALSFTARALNDFLIAAATGGIVLIWFRLLPA